MSALRRLISNLPDGELCLQTRGGVEVLSVAWTTPEGPWVVVVTLGDAWTDARVEALVRETWLESIRALDGATGSPGQDANREAS